MEKSSKIVFLSWHAVLQIVVSANGPQYSVAILKEFVIQYGFTQTTNTPNFLKQMKLLKELFILLKVS